MGYRNIIFDLDGILIHSAELTGSIIDRMLTERYANAVANRGLVRAMDALGGAVMIAAVMGPYTADPAADLEVFSALHRTIDIPGGIVFPGVAETLDQLQGMGVGMAICSNKPQVLCEKILGDLGLDRSFAAIVGSQPDRQRKPDPASAFIALAALGGTPGETLFCGDSAIDLATARGARCDPCLVNWGYGTAVERESAPEVPLLESMADLVLRVHDSNGLGLFAGRGDPGR